MAVSRLPAVSGLRLDWTIPGPALVSSIHCASKVGFAGHDEATRRTSRKVRVRKANTRAREEALGHCARIGSARRHTVDGRCLSVLKKTNDAFPADQQSVWGGHTVEVEACPRGGTRKTDGPWTDQRSHGGALWGGET